MRHWKKIIWICVMTIVMVVMALSSIVAQERLKIIKVDRAPKIDGVLTDDIWKLAEEHGSKIDSFYIFGALEHMAMPADLLICYDDDEIYIAFTTYVNTSRLKAWTILHDGPVWQDDCIEVFINPDLPEVNSGYQFIVNARGTTGDTSFTCIDKILVDFDWEPLWRVGILQKHAKDKWIVEIAIPFDAVDADPPEEGDIWGFNVTKRITEIAESGTWSKITGGSFHAPHMYNQIEFGPLVK